MYKFKKAIPKYSALVYVMCTGQHGKWGDSASPMKAPDRQLGIVLSMAIVLAIACINHLYA